MNTQATSKLTAESTTDTKADLQLEVKAAVKAEVKVVGRAKAVAEERYAQGPRALTPIRKA